MLNIRKFSKIKKRFRSKEYRDGFVWANVCDRIAYQLKAMRSQRGLTQSDLAKLVGTRQGVISRLENPDRGPCNIKTLLKVASKLDVAVDVSFVPFSKLAKSYASMTTESLMVDSYEEDEGFVYVDRRDNQPIEQTLYIDLSEKQRKPSSKVTASPNTSVTVIDKSAIRFGTRSMEGTASGVA